MGIDTINMVPSSFYDETVNLVNGAFITVKLIDLKPYSLYNITVQAVTEFGSSDLAVVVTGRTDEGGKQYAQQRHCSYVYSYICHTVRTCSTVVYI